MARLPPASAEIELLSKRPSNETAETANPRTRCFLFIAPPHRRARSARERRKIVLPGSGAEFHKIAPTFRKLRIFHRHVESHGATESNEATPPERNDFDSSHAKLIYSR